MDAESQVPHVTIMFHDSLELSEVAPFADSLGSYWEHGSLLSQFDYVEVRTVRVPRPHAATGFIEAATVVILLAGGLITRGFLEELGKDAWRGVRAKLYELYKLAAARGKERGSHALSIEMVVNACPVILRIQSDTLSEEELNSALDAARALVKADMFGFELQPDMWGKSSYFLIWEPGTDTWQAMRVPTPTGDGPTGF